jgi:hypothetical protein
VEVYEKIGDVTWTDEDGNVNTEIIDELFNISVFKKAFPDAKVEWYGLMKLGKVLKLD